MKHLARYFVVAFVLLISPEIVFAELQKNEQSIMISSFKTSSTSEMVELFNPATDLDVSGWYIEYSNVSGSNIKKVAQLGGIFISDSYMSFTSAAYDQLYGQGSYQLLYSGMADSGGFLRLYKSLPDGMYEVVDEIGWTSSSELSPNTSIISLPTTKSAHRCTNSDGVYMQRTNQQDFYVTDTPLVESVGDLCSDLVNELDDEEEADDDVVEVVNVCAGIRINELLPNPAGDDNGREFIEFHNSSDAVVSLTGCILQIDEWQHVFPAVEIDPHGFLTIYSSEVNLSLLNSRATSVYLLASDGTELQEIIYPADLDDDQSWSYDSVQFVATYTPTPDAQNSILVELPCQEGYIRNPQTNRCNKVVTEVASVQQCSIGYERNPTTGRCKKISTASTALAPCPAGEARNPQTNRCKTTEKSGNKFVPCDDGEFRNPETNRCKKIDTGTTLAPCPVGQTRNPESNRCRTDGEVDEPINIKDVPAKQVSTTSFPVSVIGIGALSYAVYEWKHEIRRLMKKLFRR